MTRKEYSQSWLALLLYLCSTFCFHRVLCQVTLLRPQIDKLDFLATSQCTEMKGRVNIKFKQIAHKLNVGL